MSLLLCRQQAKVIETLPGDRLSISVFDATLVQSDPLPVFLVDGSTDALLYGRSSCEAFTTLIELCFGMGIGTIGCQAAGVVPVRAAYGSLPMVEAYRSMHPEVPCIQGDVSSQETTQCLYKAYPKPAVKKCGVSSRPFSSGDYQRGANDQSSNTLPAALRAGYMLRAIALVLEGVQDAATNSMVRQQVDTLQDQCDYPLNETTWHVAQVWVSRRTGWWVTLAVGFVGAVPLRAPVPISGLSGPRDLLPASMNRHPALIWDDFHDLVLQGPAFRQLFGPTLKVAVHRWILCIWDLAQPLRWVSYLLLCISFRRHQGARNITKRDGKWVAELRTRAELANHIRLNIRGKHFCRKVQPYLRDANVRCSCAATRPTSHGDGCFRGSVGFLLSQQVFQAVDGFLLGRRTGPATGARGMFTSLRGV